MKKMIDWRKQVRVTFTIAVTMMMMCSLTAHAQSTLRISVKDAQFTRPLVERLAKEYGKQHPEVSIVTVSGGEAEGTVQLSENGQAAIGRFVVLPIANSENAILQNKKVRKGLNDKLERQIFVQLDYLEALDAQEEGVKALPGTVYALTGSKAFTTRLFAKRLNVQPNKIKGKKILGREENALSAVRQHKDAISFNVANLVYNTEDGSVGEGLSVFAVDLDGNGRISDEERLAISNLSSLTDFLDKSEESGLPTGDIAIDTHNGTLLQFTEWARQEGQQYLHGQGFLKTANTLTAQR